MLKIKILFYCLIFLGFNTNLFSKENDYFLTLKNNKVNVRYGPGFDYKVKFIYKKKNLPILVIDKKDNFRRIIDLKKNSGWIHRTQLKKSKSIILLNDQILFNNSSKFSKPLVKLLKGRLLIVEKCKLKWCNIKTGTYEGWVFNNGNWGIKE
tara:strand:+ start:325 stop:780 length:456 start_codon:yes stop_codon:yes gene_type:complete